MTSPVGLLTRFGDIVDVDGDDAVVIDPGPPTRVLRAGTRRGQFNVWTQEANPVAWGSRKAGPLEWHRVVRQIFRHLGSLQSVPVGTAEDCELLALATRLTDHARNSR